MKVTRSIPLYRQIAETLRKQVFTHWKPNDELPGDQQLAKEFGVSPLTVREALSVLGEQGLIERRVGSGTRIVQPRIGTHQVVAVLIDKDLTHPHFPHHFLPAYELLRRAFAKSGLRAELYVGYAEPTVFHECISSTEFVRDLEAGRIAAVVTLIGYAEERYVRYAAEHSVPWASLSRAGEVPVKVFSNTEETMNQLIDALVAQGKRRIALMGWQGFWGTDQISAERRKHFTEGLKRHGAATHDNWIRLDLYPGLSGAGWSQIRTLWSSQDEKPDGIIFWDDLLYRDALPAILRLNVRVPDELALCVLTRNPARLPIETPLIVAEVDQHESCRIIHDQIMAGLITGQIEPMEYQISTRVRTIDPHLSERETLTSTSH